MTSYRFIGTGTTDATGVARLTKDPQGQTINGYTGQGIGEVDFVASLDNPITDDSLVSEPHIVWDTLFFDTGLDDTAIWNTNNKFDKTITSNGTRITCKTGQTWASMTPKQANYSFTIPFKITLNLVDVNQLALQFSNIGGGNKRIYLTNSGEYTIEVKPDGVFVNGVNKNIGVPTDNTSVFVMQIIDETKYAVFKDLKIFKGDGLRWIALNGDKSIIQSTETATLTAKLLDSDGTPMTNKNLDLYKNDTFVDSYTTDSNGVVSYTYTGVGDGELDFQFKYGSLVSVIYSIFDVILNADELTDFEIQSGTLTVSDGVFTKGSDGNVNLLNPSNPVRMGWNGAKTIEFDVDTVSTLAVQFYLDASHRFGQRIANMGGTNGSHVKIVYDGETITPYIDGVEKTSYKVTTTLSSNYLIGFQNQGAFRNVVVY